jgi:lipopolysaccharide biosynthesis glycosyltransferase
LALSDESLHQRRGRAAPGANLSRAYREGYHLETHSPVLVCAADELYSFPLAVMLYSALLNYRGKEGIEIYVLDAGMSATSKRRMLRVLAPFQTKTHWLTPRDEALNKLPAGYSIYLRLLIPDLLPPTITKALYLDSDILVATDLALLWDQEVGDNYFLAARDRGSSSALSRLSSCTDARFEQDSEYFNSGVLLMNLTRMRLDGIAAKVIAFGRKWGEALAVPEQDGLNVVAVGNWGKLDRRWNCLVNKVDESTHKSDAIFHFMGHAKPWGARNEHMMQRDDIGPYHRLYDDYARQSGWFTTPMRLRYLLTRRYFLWIKRIKRLIRTLARACR